MLKRLEPAHEFEGKSFSCPACGMGLPIKSSIRQKPYCTCNDCGIQIFFRGKAGIARLHKIVEAQEPVAIEFPATSLAGGLYNRIQQLKKKRDSLEKKRRFRFFDKDLDNVISSVNAEIKETQLALKKAKEQAVKDKK